MFTVSLNISFDLNDLEHLLSTGKIFSDTRVKELDKYSIKTEGKFIASGFSRGSRNSYRYLSIYNKTAEAKSKGKQYILNHHEKNGLTERELFQFEFKLKNDFFKYNPLAAKGHFSFVKDHLLRKMVKVVMIERRK